MITISRIYHNPRVFIACMIDSNRKEHSCKMPVCRQCLYIVDSTQFNLTFLVLGRLRSSSNLMDKQRILRRYLNRKQKRHIKPKTLRLDKDRVKVNIYPHLASCQKTNMHYQDLDIIIYNLVILKQTKIIKVVTFHIKIDWRIVIYICLKALNIKSNSQKMLGTIENNE